MTVTENGHVRSLDGRADLAGRLRARSSEIEESIFARVRDTVLDPADNGDAEYVAGLRAAVTAVVDYGLTGIEQGEEGAGPIPSVAVAQAQRAARGGVGLETVLLRYAAGHRLMSDFVVTEADHFPSHALRQVLDTQGLLFERLVAAISTEYKREVQRAGRSPEQRRAERVRRLLAGEPLDTAELGLRLRRLAPRRDRNGHTGTGDRRRPDSRLRSPAHDRVAWRGDGVGVVRAGGEGRRSRILERQLPAKRDVCVLLAVGELGSGIEGWRLTRHQAQEALLVALHRPRRLTRYAEDMLLAAALRDKTLARSLKELYLSPLAGERDGGSVSRETLRAYFTAGRNAATAAHRLGVDRHTIERRLHTIEERLGCLLHTCQPELEVALRLEGLDDATGRFLPIQ